MDNSSEFFHPLRDFFEPLSTGKGGKQKRRRIAKKQKNKKAMA